MSDQSEKDPPTRNDHKADRANGDEDCRVDAKSTCKKQSDCRNHHPRRAYHFLCKLWNGNTGREPAPNINAQIRLVLMPNPQINDTGAVADAIASAMNGTKCRERPTSPVGFRFFDYRENRPSTEWKSAICRVPEYAD